LHFYGLIEFPQSPVFARVLALSAFAFAAVFLAFCAAYFCHSLRECNDDVAMLKKD